MRALSAFFLFIFSVGVVAQSDSEGVTTQSEAGYVKPFKIADDIYYVGDQWVSSYLVNTQKGLVVIDALDMPYSKWALTNIEALGFDVADIRYLLVTHGHSDHVGGARLFEKAGARVLLSEAAMQLAQQQAADLVNTKNAFEPPIAPQWLRDGERLDMGDFQFEFVASPGHTLGSMSIVITRNNQNAAIRALVYGGMGDNFEGLAQAKSYLNSVEQMKARHRQQPFNLNLANHPHMASLFERQAKEQPFIDIGNVSDLLETLHARALNKLALESQADIQHSPSQ